MFSFSLFLSSTYSCLSFLFYYVSYVKSFVEWGWVEIHASHRLCNKICSKGQGAAIPYHTTRNRTKENQCKLQLYDVGQNCKGGFTNGVLKLAFGILGFGDLGIGCGIFSGGCVVKFTAFLGSSVVICEVRGLAQQQFPNLCCPMRSHALWDGWGPHVLSFGLLFKPALP